MTSSSDPFVVILRKAIEQNKTGSSNQPFNFLNQDHQPVSEMKDATAVSVSGNEFDFASPSGYKEYNVSSLLFFYIHHTLEHPAYMQKTMVAASEMGRELGSVTYLDRRDLLDYLTGKSSHSQHINYTNASSAPSSKIAAIPSTSQDGASMVSGTTVALDASGQKRLGDDLVFGFDIKKLKPLTEDMEQDLQAVKSILEKARTINTTASILCCNTSKNFSSIQKLGHDFFVQEKPLSTSAKNVPATTPVSKGKSAPSSAKSAAKQTKLGINDYPIIFVPAATQSLISLFNAKDLLVDQKFVPSETYRNKGENKPLQVVLERDPSKVGPTALKKFLVLDSVDSMKPQDWERVVAVFTTGQEWQFRGWKWPKPVDIFQNVLGFALKFQDEPAQGSIPNWNVNVLNIHRNRRYLDGAVVYNFWQEVDRFITMKRPNLVRN